MTQPLNIVWFKRDLRVADHRPLAEAAKLGPVLPLYIVEPDLWAQPDASGRQWAFAVESLTELQSALAALGQPLCVTVGDAVAIFREIHKTHGVATLWSHEETGNGWTYARDLAVAAWAREAGVPWREPRQFGVIRRLKSRNGWANGWDRAMAEPITMPPKGLQPIKGDWSTHIPTFSELGLAPDPCPQSQPGGRTDGGARDPEKLSGRAWPRLSFSDVEPRHGLRRLLPPVAAPNMGHDFDARGGAGHFAAHSGDQPSGRSCLQELARLADLLHGASALALSLHAEAGG